MTKPNSAGGKFNALTLKTRLQEMQDQDANFKIAFSGGIAVVTVQIPITDKQYTRTVLNLEPGRVTTMFNLMDGIGDFVSPEDVGASAEDVAALGSTPVTMSDWMRAATEIGTGEPGEPDGQDDAAAGAPEPTDESTGDIGVEEPGEEVLDLDAEEMPHGSEAFGDEISVDPGLDPSQSQQQRQLGVGDKVTMLTDTRVTHMVLAVGPEFAGLACLHDGVVKLTCAPLQMLGFVDDIPGGGS
jgi:hypothetical protein